MLCPSHCPYCLSLTALLHRQITARCQGMLCAGLLPEVAGLLSRGLLPAQSSPGRAIGYRQTRDYLLRADAVAGDAQVRCTETEMMSNF
jgi:tRNA A37 N6-isopentenylltransferase MiaA